MIDALQRGLRWLQRKRIRPFLYCRLSCMSRSWYTNPSTSRRGLLFDVDGGRISVLGLSEERRSSRSRIPDRSGIYSSGDGSGVGGRWSPGRSGKVRSGAQDWKAVVEGARSSSPRSGGRISIVKMSEERGSSRSRILDRSGMSSSSDVTRVDPQHAGVVVLNSTSSRPHDTVWDHISWADRILYCCWSHHPRRSRHTVSHVQAKS